MPCVSSRRAAERRHGLLALPALGSQTCYGRNAEVCGKKDLPNDKREYRVGVASRSSRLWLQPLTSPRQLPLASSRDVAQPLQLAQHAHPS